MRKLSFFAALVVWFAAAATGLLGQCTRPRLQFTFAARPSPISMLLPELSCAGRFAAAGGQAAVPQIGGQARKGSPGHIFFIIPAYNVEYIRNAPPLTPKEKFDEFVEEIYDPVGLAASAFEAAVLEHDHTGFCGYGHGWGGYGKCYGAALLDGNVSGFIGDFMMPSLLHQDPRYFRLGQGGFRSRVWYSLTRTFIARSDHGGWTFGSGALTGTVAAGALSNLYYPKADRGWGLTMSRIGIDLGGTAIFNLEAEFWPDIVGWAKHR